MIQQRSFYKGLSHPLSVKFQSTGLSFSLAGKNYCQHTTALFRADNVKQILGLPQLLQTFFPGGCPIYDYACSDGSEAYSIAITLNETSLPREKYPILARDISSAILQVPKSGYVPLMPWDCTNLNEYFPKAKFNKYFELVPRAVPDNVHSYYQLDEMLTGYQLSKYDEDERLYRVSKLLRQWINFQQGDLGADHFKQPGIFFFQNQFYHFNPIQEEELLRHLYQNMPSGSILLGGPTSERAQRIGFKPLYPDAAQSHPFYSALIKPIVLGS